MLGRDAEVGKRDVVRNGWRRCDADMALQSSRDGGRGSSNGVRGSGVSTEALGRGAEVKKGVVRLLRFSLSIPEPKLTKACYIDRVVTKESRGIEHGDGRTVNSGARRDVTWRML